MIELESFEKAQERKRIEQIENNILTLKKSVSDLSEILKDTLDTIILEHKGVMAILEAYKKSKEIK